MDQISSTVTLTVGRASVPTLVFEPLNSSPGRAPAVVISSEAYGVNEFAHRVASGLAALGYVVVVPDYYHGDGLEEPDNYADFTEVLTFIDALDFGQGTHDVMAAIDYARGRSDVDPDRVAVWGYCTGATLAMLAASLDRRLAAAVLFFPSQPTFPELGAKRPVQPIDMIWNIAGPVQLLYGDQDPTLLAVAPEIERRCEQWGIDLDVRVYPGAGHAFSAPEPPLHHAEADQASWADATAFLARHCPTELSAPKI